MRRKIVILGVKGGSSPFLANEYLINNNTIKNSIINNDFTFLSGVTPLKPLEHGVG